MVKGVTGAASLCVSVPFLWFQWGLPAALCGALVLSAIIGWRSPVPGLTALLLTAILLFRLEAEADHALPRDWQHRVASLEICLDQPLQRYEDYQSGLARVVNQPESLALRRIRLTADSGLSLQAGECLMADIRLRQPVGRLIPGQFNPTRYYFSERIDALATVTEVTGRAGHPGLAARFYQRAGDAFNEPDALGVWAALALGWSQTLDADLADLFEQNQIKHLVVVSGMHVGMVAAWALLLATLVSRLPGPGRGGRPVWLRFVLACGASGAFVALTGFGFPGVRAWVMLTIPLAAFALGVRLSGVQVLALAAVAITLIRPQAWLSTGAWLSFGLVWVLIRLAERWHSESLPAWHLAIRLQVGLALLMIPVAALMGFHWHPLSIPINLVMIPLVTLVILPWSLVILAVPSLAWVSGYETMVGQGVRLLAWLAPWHLDAPAWSLVELMLVGMGLALLSSQLYSPPYRWLLVPLPLLALAYPAVPEPPREFRLTMLDVGHGEALVLQWPGQTWLYDTAGQWSNGQSIAAQRLAPWFRRRDIQPDGIIVSHSDADHAGGAGWATKRWPRAARLSGEPEAVGRLSGTPGWRSCHRHPPDRPEMHWPAIPAAFRTNDNDRSCVVAIPTSAGPVLITGDASRMVEYWLLQAYPGLFPAGVQVIGHHGSHTSSARPFLDASPEALLLVSSGDRSLPRWPNPGLLDYLDETGQSLLSTARRGTLEVTVADGDLSVRDWSSSYRRRLIRNKNDN